MSMKTCNLTCLQTPLHSASIKGDVQCAEMLMEHVRSPTKPVTIFIGAN